MDDVEASLQALDQFREQCREAQEEAAINQWANWRNITYPPEPTIHTCSSECRRQRWIMHIPGTAETYGCLKNGLVHHCDGKQMCKMLYTDREGSLRCVFSHTVLVPWIASRTYIDLHRDNERNLEYVDAGTTGGYGDSDEEKPTTGGWKPAKNGVEELLNLKLFSNTEFDNQGEEEEEEFIEWEDRPLEPEATEFLEESAAIVASATIVAPQSPFHPDGAVFNELGLVQSPHTPAWMAGGAATCYRPASTPGHVIESGVTPSPSVYMSPSRGKHAHKVSKDLRREAAATSAKSYIERDLERTMEIRNDPSSGGYHKPGEEEQRKLEMENVPVTVRRLPAEERERLQKKRELVATVKQEAKKRYGTQQTVVLGGERASIASVFAMDRGQSRVLPRTSGLSKHAKTYRLVRNGLHSGETVQCIQNGQDRSVEVDQILIDLLWDMDPRWDTFVVKLCKLERRALAKIDRYVRLCASRKGVSDRKQRQLDRSHRSRFNASGKRPQSSLGSSAGGAVDADEEATAVFQYGEGRPDGVHKVPMCPNIHTMDAIFMSAVTSLQSPAMVQRSDLRHRYYRSMILKFWNYVSTSLVAVPKRRNVTLGQFSVAFLYLLQSEGLTYDGQLIIPQDEWLCEHMPSQRQLDWSPRTKKLKYPKTALIFHTRRTDPLTTHMSKKAEDAFHRRHNQRVAQSTRRKARKQSRGKRGGFGGGNELYTRSTITAGGNFIKQYLQVYATEKHITPDDLAKVLHPNVREMKYRTYKSTLI